MGLQKRLLFFLLLPAACVLITVGAGVYLFSEKLLLQEWRKGAVSRLQWAAHHIDMRLQRPMDWMEILHTTGEFQRAEDIQPFIIEQIESLAGVAGVTLHWEEGSSPPQAMAHGGHGTHSGMHPMPQMKMGMMRFHRAEIARVTPPRFATGPGEKIVTVVSDFEDEAGRPLGRMEVDILFSHLLENILELGWWQTRGAYLVDDQGQILAGTGEAAKRERCLGADGSEIEKELLRALQEKKFGTVQETGFFPDQVGGFYRLERAPWSLVLLAPGEKVLAPLLKFRNFYGIAGLASIFFIVLFIRALAGRTVNRIKEVSDAAESIAAGEHGEALDEKGPPDEITLLVKSFNRMIEGLRERDVIRNTFGRYVDREVAKELISRPEAARLGGERREVSMLMSDLRGFSELSESLKPEEIVALLNTYLDRMIRAVIAHKGIIVDFFGDALLVFFDPLEGPLKPAVQKSIQCAFAMQEQLRQFNEKDRPPEVPALQMGIGVHAGEVIVGNIGSRDRAKYGIVGSAVNLTSRIQALAGAGEILASRAAYNLAQDRVSAGASLTVELKGIPGPVTLFPLRAEKAVT